MRQQYHFRESEKGLLAWDLCRLLELSGNLDVIQIPLDQIKELDEPFWYGLGNAAPTCRHVLEHAILIKESDLSVPIILCHEGRIMDGMHRVCKAVMKGETHIRALQFKEDVPPDYVDVLPEDLPYEKA